MVDTKGTANTQGFFHGMASRFLAAVGALCGAAISALVMCRILGLSHSSETSLVSALRMASRRIFDDGTIAILVSIAVAPLGASLAARDAGIGRSGTLGVLTGAIVAVIVSGVSRVGISDGAALAFAALGAAIVVGFGLRLGLNRAAGQPHAVAACSLSSTGK